MSGMREVIPSRFVSEQGIIENKESRIRAEVIIRSNDVCTQLNLQVWFLTSRLRQGNTCSKHNLYLSMIATIIYRFTIVNKSSGGRMAMRPAADRRM